MAGLYIHIPFCKRRCSYCDFYSVTKNEYIDRYVSALLGELVLRSEEINLLDVQTIYIGGGTPSVLSLQQLSNLMNGLKNKINFSNVGEVTIEVNPDDITKHFSIFLKRLGINRVSMGVQSFVDAELSAVNRRHNADQAIKAVEMLQMFGADNISIDLIYGLPGQTVDSWHYSVDRAIRLGINHISAYCLSYEPGTALTKLRDMGRVQEADDEICVKMYEDLCRMLKTAGYDHYEISNFAKPGCLSVHNSNYWNGTPYLGLGAAAHSYDGNVRRYNPCDLSPYLGKIEKGVVAFETEEETWWERYDEMIMVRLRTKWGVDVEDIASRFGRDVADRFKEKAKPFVSNGEMSITGNVYAITQNGVMLSDAIIRELMYDDE